jgi:hypothetical protein
MSRRIAVALAVAVLGGVAAYNPSPVGAASPREAAGGRVASLQRTDARVTTRPARSGPSGNGGVLTPWVSRAAAGPPARIEGIGYPIRRLRRLQALVDRGDRRYRRLLDPVKVTLYELPHYGFTRGGIAVVSPSPPHPSPTAHAGEDGYPETDVVVRYRARKYWIVLNQLMRRGPGGIWLVITITPM